MQISKISYAIFVHIHMYTCVWLHVAMHVLRRQEFSRHENFTKSLKTGFQVYLFVRHLQTFDNILFIVSGA